MSKTSKTAKNLKVTCYTVIVYKKYWFHIKKICFKMI